MHFRLTGILVVLQAVYACSVASHSSLLEYGIVQSDIDRNDKFMYQVYARDQPTDEDAFCRNISYFCPFLRSKTARPSAVNKKVNVTVIFYQKAAMSVDDAQQIFTMKAQLFIFWQLPICATWNHHVPHGNLTVTPEHCEYTVCEMWTPKLDFHNAARPLDSFSPFKPSSTIRIFSNGIALWVNNIKVATTCNLNYKRYPFDKQQCGVVIKPRDDTVVFTEYRYDMSTIGDKVKTPMEESDIWNVDNYTLVAQANQIVLTVVLSRKWYAYVGTVFIPTVLLAVTQLSAIAMPPESTDRGAYLITAFVAMAVFQSTLISDIPTTSEVLDINMYYTVLMAVAVMVTVYSLIICRLMAHYERQLATKQRGMRYLRTVDIVDMCVFLLALSVTMAANIYLVGDH